MIVEFSSKTIEWRGPAPFIFAPVPHEISTEIKAISSLVTYGWGCIPVVARIGKTRYKTSLFPKNGIYLVPIKVVVQKAESVMLGDEVTIQLEIRPRSTIKMW